MTNRGALEYKARQSGFANYEQFKAYKRDLDKGFLTETPEKQRQAQELWKKTQKSIQQGQQQIPRPPGSPPRNALQAYQFQFSRLMRRGVDLPGGWARSPK
jgi:hypothetical protein